MGMERGQVMGMELGQAIGVEQSLVMGDRAGSGDGIGARSDDRRERDGIQTSVKHRREITGRSRYTASEESFDAATHQTLAVVPKSHPLI